jgi:hypothetical protein
LLPLYRRKVARLHELLENDVSRTEAVEIIGSLVDQVTFRPTADGSLEIELVGHLARMVYLAKNSSENNDMAGPLTKSSLVR